MSKGSRQRPGDLARFEAEFDRIFRTDPVKKNMDKLTRPATHADRKKEAKKTGEYNVTDN